MYKIVRLRGTQAFKLPIFTKAKKMLRYPQNEKCYILYMTDKQDVYLNIPVDKLWINFIQFFRLPG